MNTQEIIDMYGLPGENQTYCHTAYPLRLAWDTKVAITRFSCHKDIQYRLESIFKEINNAYTSHDINALGLDLFGGCLNIRKKRKGNTLSLHSWGLALDIDPLHNRLSWSKEKARLHRQEYDDFWEIVKKFGGFSMGIEKNYDWMHIQFLPII